MLKNFLFGIALLYALEGVPQQKIEEARQEATGETVTVSGIVTNGESLGIIRYFQDETGGLAAYGEQTSGIKRGDSITITGTLKDYNNLLELDPIASVTVHSSNRPLPAPVELTPGEPGEAYEGQLVRINNAEFTEASGTFGSNAN